MSYEPCRHGIPIPFYCQKCEVTYPFFDPLPNRPLVVPKIPKYEGTGKDGLPEWKLIRKKAVDD